MSKGLDSGFKTRSQLLLARKEERHNFEVGVWTKHDVVNQKQVENILQVQRDYYAREQPLRDDIGQNLTKSIRSSIKLKARLDNGLNPEPDNTDPVRANEYTLRGQALSKHLKSSKSASKINTVSSSRYGLRNMPGLTYVHKPSTAMQSQLLSKRKTQLLEENLRSVKNIEASGTYKTELERLAENEQVIVARGYYQQQMQQSKSSTKSQKIDPKLLKRSKTKTDLDMIRRQVNKEQTMAKFGTQSVGIHGQELPSYHGTKDLKYWELPRGYVKDPKFTSQLNMWQDRKYFAKNDEMLLGDTKLGQNPVIDSFKAAHFPLPAKKEVAEKAMTVNYLPQSKMPKQKHSRATQQRWTEHEMRFGTKLKQKGRFQDTQQAPPQHKDFDPLYTSFGPGDKFNPPMSSKEMIVKKNLKKQQLITAKILQGSSQQIKPKEGSILKDHSRHHNNEFSPGGKNPANASTFTSRNEIGQSSVDIGNSLSYFQVNPYDGLPAANSTLFKRVQSTTGFQSYYENPSISAPMDKTEDNRDGAQSLATKASTVKIQNQANENSQQGSPNQLGESSPMIGRKTSFNPKKVKDSNVGFGDYVQNNNTSRVDGHHSGMGLATTFKSANLGTSSLGFATGGIRSTTSLGVRTQAYTQMHYPAKILTDPSKNKLLQSPFTAGKETQKKLV